MGIAGALLCAEIALRFYVASRGWTANCYVTGLVFFVPDRFAGHTLRPGLRLKSSTYDITVNSYGLRGGELADIKALNTTRIAVLGGSSVFGYLVPDGQDSCCELQRILNQDGLEVEVLNAGVPGFNMTQCRQRFEHLIAPLDPDIVVLYLGWNDIRFLITDDPNALDKTPPAPAWTKRVLAKSVLYGFLRYRLFPAQAPQFAPPSSANAHVTELGAQSFDTDLKELISSIRGTGATPVISTQIMASNPDCQELDDYLGSDESQISANRQVGEWICAKLRETAYDENILLIDCAADLPCNKAVLGDAIHLTQEGHRIVAALWAKGLQPILSEAGKASSATISDPQAGP